MAPGSAFTNNFGNGADAMKSAYAEAIDTTSAGSPATGISRGQVRVGRRPSPGSANGRRYSSWSSGARSQIIALGRTASTNRFFSNTMSSPAGDRKAWKMPRAASGHSSHVAMGRTMASM